MQRKWLVLLIVVLCLLISVGYAWAAEDAKKTGSVVIVVIDRLDISDINTDALPGFKKLMSEGSVGLLNTRSAGNYYAQHAYTTIGAGTPSYGVGSADMAFDVNEQLEAGKAKDVYRQRTGNQPPAEGIIQLSMPQLELANSEQFRTVQLGAIGTQLHKAGYKTAVFGNTDYSDQIGRQAVVIAMDNQGIVDGGLIDDSILLTDPSFPGGKRTDYAKMLDCVLQSLDEYQLIVVELGDTTRLHEQKNMLYENVYQAHLAKTLKRADQFLTELAAGLGKKDLLMVVSPTPSAQMLEKNRLLTPIIVYGEGYNGDGSSEQRLLVSGTTKHPGIVVNTDIAASTLNHLGVDFGTNIIGRAMYIQPLNGDAGQYLQDKMERLAVTYSARAPLQQGYVAFHIIIIAVALWSILVRQKAPKWLKPALLAVVSVPLAYLLMSLLPLPSVPLAGLELLVIALALAAIVSVLAKNSFTPAFLILAVATSTLLLVDIALGQPLQKQAILSYDPMVGARFYGIGNEYMGVFVGATIIAASIVVDNFAKHRKFVIALIGLLFVVSIYFLAAPHLGTNVGGTIAAVVSFTVTFLLFLNIKMRPKAVIAVVGIVLLILLGFIAFDLTRPIQQQSHIGQTARLIMDGGFVEILNVIQRKLSMNLKLMRYTVWTRVLLASIIALAILYYKPRGVMQRIKEKYPYIFKGLIGVIVGALVAFAFNDSGVVAAATTMIFGAPPLIYLVINEQADGGD